MPETTLSAILKESAIDEGGPAKLARKLGIGRVALHRWIAGAAVPSVRGLVAIARYMGMAVDDVAEWAGLKQPAAIGRVGSPCPAPAIH